MASTLTSKFITLLACNQRISAANTLAELGERVVEAATDLVSPDAVAVHVTEEDGENLTLVAKRGEGWTVPDELPLDGDSLAARAAREGTAVLVPDLSALAGGDTLLLEGSQFAVPMRVGGKAVGVISAWRQCTGSLAEDDDLLLRSLASYAGASVSDLHIRGELSRQRSNLQSVLDCSADAIITTDRRGKIDFFSPGAVEMFGFQPEEIRGARVSDYYLGGEREARHVQAYLEEEGKVRNYEAWFKTAQGEPVPTSLSASLLRGKDGEVRGTLGILKDITVEKRLERKLSYTIEMLQEANENLARLAVTDSLSGLKNQRYFRRKLEEELLRASRTKSPVSLLLMDIDKFKKFNDEHGHQVGDRVIQEMGSTITACIRQIDHGCRYGGEEFTVILPDTEPEGATVVARRIQARFASGSVWKELGLDGPTVSIGLCAYHEDQTGPLDSDTIVKLADEAMYQVKGAGGNDVQRLGPGWT